jgi:hypothetical protein
MSKEEEGKKHSRDTCGTLGIKQLRSRTRKSGEQSVIDASYDRRHE